MGPHQSLIVESHQSSSYLQFSQGLSVFLACLRTHLGCVMFVRDSKIIFPGPRHQEDVLRGEAVVGKMARHPQGNQIPQETQPSKLHILLWVLPQRTHRLGKKTRIRGRANHVKQNLAHWFPPCFGCEYFLRLKHIHPRV